MCLKGKLGLRKGTFLKANLSKPKLLFGSTVLIIAIIPSELCSKRDEK